MRHRADRFRTPPKAARFQGLAEAELPRLYGLARHLIGDNEAEDLVQDCLLRGYRAFGDLEDETAAPAWLSRILVNCFRDRLRSRSGKPQLVEIDDVEEFSLYQRIAEEDPYPYSDSVHLDFLERFDREDVRAVLAGIPDQYRVPLVLVHVLGYYVKEVAAMLEVPLGTMLARLHRGRKLFERKLWEYAEANDLLREEVHA